jgi:tRNA-specific 2-thiouridylase
MRLSIIYHFLAGESTGIFGTGGGPLGPEPAFFRGAGLGRKSISGIIKESGRRKKGRMRRKQVVVAMSGGVDSSVAAGLLQKKGYDVIGVTMNLFSLPGKLCRSEELRSCCGRKAVEDAHEVAVRLGIEHLVVDFRREFQGSVIADFCQEYSQGRTPNPCIRCNEWIKFGLLQERAKRLGADYVATGHHARVVFSRSRKRYLLKKGKDRAKDQSYFLYPLGQEQLSRTLMPVGDLTKKDVREMARAWGLGVAEKQESQEICFVPAGRYPAFLKNRVPQVFSPGQIRDAEGRVLGEHRGVINFTVGQRRGIGLAAPQPLYVVSISGERNTIVVGNRNALYRKRLLARRVNLISLEKLERPIDVTAKIRHKHDAARARVFPLPRGRVLVEFEKPQRAVTPGQSVVFYQRDVVVGGGIIETPLE